MLAVASCGLLCALIAAPAGAAGPLIAQWPLDASHSSGGSDYTDDVSGNGLALASPAATMHFGTALGKFGGYLANSNTTPLQVTSPLLAPQQLTLMAWIKQNGDPGTLRYIAGRGDDGGICGGSSYALYTGYAALPGLHFYVRTPGPTAPGVVSDAPPNASVFDNSWHLVAGTYDGTDVRLYVDGNQVGPAKPAPAITYAPPITGSSFFVDGYSPSAGCPDQTDFPGQIDETRVYDRALSRTELARLAAAPGPEPPALVPDADGETNSPPASASVSLRSLGAVPRGGFAGLEIKTSGPAAETQIAIDGGKPAFRVDPTTTPLLGLRLAQPGSHTVTATTIGANGATSSASTSVLIKPGSSETRRPAYFPDVAVATTTPRLLTSVLGTQTATDKACVPGSTVFFGAVEATGCFKKVESVDDIPAPERAAASEFLSTNILIENAHVLRPCKLSEPSCHGEAEAALAKDPNLKPFVSTQPVLVNGMTIAPRPGSSIVVFPAISRVISHDARISYDGSVFGSIPVKTGPLNMDVSSNIKRFTNGDAEVPLFSFDTSQAFKDIGGFPINGSVQVVFKKVGENRSTALVVDLALPDEISTAAQADPTAKVEVKADNQRGTYLGFLNIHIDEAFLGPVELANVDFTYNDAGEPAQNCPRKWWKATAEVFFIPVDPDQNGAGLIMAPEPQRNGVAFCAGAFHSAGAALEFGYPLLPPPQIFPGVFLNKVAFDFQLKNPTLFDGSATIKSAEIVTATGGFLTAFATPAHPYTFKAGDAGGALKLLAGQKFESTTVALGGTVSIEPEDDVEMELGSAYLLYNYPDYISARGSAHIQTLVFAVNAEGAFEMSTRTRRFNAFARGEVCLAGGIKVEHVGLCAAGEGRISSRGASVCFDLIDGNWTPGVGYLYGDLVPEFFFGAVGDGCKPSHFWEEDVRAARISAARPGVEARPTKGAASASAAAGLSFEVKRGETSKTVELTGAGGAPAVTVRARVERRSPPSPTKCFTASTSTWSRPRSTRPPGSGSKTASRAPMWWNRSRVRRRSRRWRRRDPNPAPGSRGRSPERAATSSSPTTPVTPRARESPSSSAARAPGSRCARSAAARERSPSGRASANAGVARSPPRSKSTGSRRRRRPSTTSRRRRRPARAGSSTSGSGGTRTSSSSPGAGPRSRGPTRRSSNSAAARCARCGSRANATPPASDTSRPSKAARSKSSPSARWAIAAGRPRRTSGRPAGRRAGCSASRSSEPQRPSARPSPPRRERACEIDPGLVW